jgi:Fe2+ or Zn2+ uptake regulation protein
MTTTADTDIRLVEALRARGHRVTPQRLVIHRVLRDLSRHASAEEVLDAVDDRLPGVSLPTVYATLELLGELGLARRVGPAGGRVLFDPRLDEHAHLVCASCGRVEDIDTSLDTGKLLATARGKGWSNAKAGVVVTGLCGNCSTEAPTADS